MRSFADEKQYPLLWASTYCAGEHLDPSAVAEFHGRKKAAKRLFEPHIMMDKMLEVGSPHSDLKGKAHIKVEPHNMNSNSYGVTITSKMMAIQGYKAQSEMVIEYLDRLITHWELRNESAIVEGVHLSLNFVV